MQFKAIFLTSFLALGASALSSSNATDIAPAVQNRIAKIDLGYQQIYLLLNHLVDNTNSVSADDVVAAYNAIANVEGQDLGKNQPMKPLSEPVQLVLCQAYHSLALNGIQLNNAFVDYAVHFDKKQRTQMQTALTRVNDETGRFFIHVAKPALSYCLTTLQTDDTAIYKSLVQAARALDPSEAL